MTPAEPPHGPPEAEQIRTLWKAQRAALAEAFPDWEITCVTDLSIPLWFALYRPPLTCRQERDGFQPTMLRGSAEELQAELARRCRTRHRPLSPPPEHRYGPGGKEHPSPPRDHTPGSLPASGGGGPSPSPRATPAGPRAIAPPPSGTLR